MELAEVAFALFLRIYLLSLDGRVMTALNEGWFLALLPVKIGIEVIDFDRSFICVAEALS